MASTVRSIIYVDSNSEDEETEPKQICNSKNRRQSKQNAETVRKQRSSKQLRKTPIEIDDDDDGFIHQGDSMYSKLPLSSADLRCNILPVPETDVSAGLLRTTQVIDVSMAENDVSTVPQPRKTARRGLAKKHCEPQTNDNTTVTVHKASVYSQAIAEGFKSLIHGIGPGVDEDTGNNVTAETKKVDAELSSINMGSTLIEAQKVFSQQNRTDIGDDPDCIISSFRIQSPSPPPEMQARPAKRMNKELTKALKALSRAKGILDSTTPPSKRNQKRDSDVIIVGEEFGLSQDIIVKVLYLTKVHRFQMKLNEPFHILINKLSKEINEDEHDLALFLNDESLKATESPQSVKLSVADIIECHCLKVSENSICTSDAIELVIQCCSNRKRTTLTANRRRPLSDIMQKYAQLMNDDVGSFAFSFDGEDIEPLDTPNKLGMEDHDVIDVVHN